MLLPCCKLILKRKQEAMKFFYVCVLALVPTFSFADNSFLSHVINGTSNEVYTSFVDEVKIERRTVRVLDGCCLKFECRDFAVTYRKKVWIEKVPVIQNLPKTFYVNECVYVQQCINGCNVIVPTTVTKQIVINQPTLIGYTDKIIRFGIPCKTNEQIFFRWCNDYVN